MVETFEFLNDKYKAAPSTFFEFPHISLWDHSHKIFKDAKTEVA